MSYCFFIKNFSFRKNTKSKSSPLFHSQRHYIQTFLDSSPCFVLYNISKILIKKKKLKGLNISKPDYMKFAFLYGFQCCLYSICKSAAIQNIYRCFVHIICNLFLFKRYLNICHGASSSAGKLLVRSRQKALFSLALFRSVERRKN